MLQNQDYTMNFRQLPFLKVAAIIAALIIAGGIYYYSVQAGDQATVTAASNSEIQPVKLNVAPPFSGEKINVAPTIRVIQPEAPTVLTLNTGATITIPAAVFVTMDNRPVTKPVEIHFREFHKAHEIIAGGIPMRVYDVQGKEQWMQTAGMFDVQGYSEGRPVKIAEGKTITVNLPSGLDGNCEFWHFDPKIGNWKMLAVTPAYRDSLQPERLSEQEAVAQATKSLPRKPVKPVLVNKEKPVLDFDINYDALPELKNVGGILWQYAGNDPKQDPANNRSMLERRWDYAKVEPTDQPNVFEMTLTQGREKLSLPVQACRSRANFEKAMADYREEYKKYETKREKALEKIAFQEDQAEFVRSFQIERLGIYNWDYLLKREDAVPVVADFDFGNDVPADIKKEVTVCLITGGGRTVITFPYSDWRNFTFSPGMGNRLVAILPGNQVAVFSQEDFTRESAAIRQAKGKPYVFKMNVLQEKISSIADLKKVTG